MIRMSCLILSILLITLCACSDNTRKEQIPELVFTVDGSLLSETVTNDSLNISFRVPLELHPLDEKYRKEFAARMSAMNPGDMNVTIKPEYIYIDSLNSFFMMVNTIASQDSLVSPDSVESKYNAFLTRQLGPRLLRQGQFRKKDMLVTQFVVQDGQTTNMKLYFKQGRQLVQFDYFVLSQYDERIKTIESSIGSIKQPER